METQVKPSETERATLLVVDDLSVAFNTPRGVLKAVDGVSLSLERGRTVGIVGESGSGKSVLARAIMGLTKSGGGTAEGAVHVNGHEMLSMSSRNLRQTMATEVAMVFQDPMTSLNPVVKIGRQVTEAMVAHLGISKKDAFERGVDLLEQVGIPSPRNRMSDYPHQLSGGMRQRVVIAIAIACEPSLLLADEPTTALDVTVQAQILDLLSTQQSERDMGMVLISHDFGVVATRCDDIIVMYAGQVVERGPARTLLNAPRMPYTTALIKSIPRLDGPIHARLQTVDGRPPDLVGFAGGCRFAPRCPKVQDHCRQEAPPLTKVANEEHSYRCWFPNEVPMTQVEVTGNGG